MSKVILTIEFEDPEDIFKSREKQNSLGVLIYTWAFKEMLSKVGTVKMKWNNDEPYTIQ